MKRCTKCGIEKDQEDYYKHRSMADGRLGKCKECVRKETAESRARYSMDPEWVKKERERHRIKANKAYHNGNATPPLAESRRRWAQKNKYKRLAHGCLDRAIKRGIIKRLPCEVCGDPNSHGHHHDYSKPLDVWWLCPLHHGEAHRKDNPLVIIRSHETFPASEC